MVLKMDDAIIDRYYLVRLGQERFFISTLFRIFLKDGDHRRFYRYSMISRRWYLLAKEVLLNHLREELPICIRPNQNIIDIPIEFTHYPVNINESTAIKRIKRDRFPGDPCPLNDLCVYWIHMILGDKIVLIHLGYDDNILHNTSEYSKYNISKRVDLHSKRCKNIGYKVVEPSSVVSCLTNRRLIE